MQILYFSWLRERVGEASEDIETSAATPADLIAELKARGSGHAMAFEDITAIRVAVDQQMVELDHPLAGAREVAFFPPMTGG
ncbi:MAG: molybdopterin converting factor subunit 1 [Pseudomonadota bacterium]